MIFRTKITKIKLIFWVYEIQNHSCLTSELFKIREYLFEYV